MIITAFVVGVLGPFGILGVSLYDIVIVAQGDSCVRRHADDDGWLSDPETEVCGVEHIKKFGYRSTRTIALDLPVALLLDERKLDERNFGTRWLQERFAAAVLAALLGIFLLFLGLRRPSRLS